MITIVINHVSKSWDDPPNALLYTNIAMENPPFRCYLQGTTGIFHRDLRVMRAHPKHARWLGSWWHLLRLAKWQYAMPLMQQRLFSTGKGGGSTYMSDEKDPG